MDKIELTGIKCYAYHGCLKEEAQIGQEYIVDVVLQLNLESAYSSDNLNETVDYCEVYAIVKNEMAERSKLIESVGKRIAQKIRSSWNSLQSVEVKVRKPNPPIGGEVDEVSISVTG